MAFEQVRRDGFVDGNVDKLRGLHHALKLKLTLLVARFLLVGRCAGRRVVNEVGHVLSPYQRRRVSNNVRR